MINSKKYIEKEKQGNKFNKTLLLYNCTFRTLEYVWIKNLKKEFLLKLL